jgi:hypothetical protein
MIQFNSFNNNNMKIRPVLPHPTIIGTDCFYSREHFVRVKFANALVSVRYKLQVSYYFHIIIIITIIIIINVYDYMYLV